MENKSLKTEKLSFSYEKNKEILHSVDLEFQTGAVTALIGANGCGKSTLLKLLSGVLKPSCGNIFLDGKSLREYKQIELARRIATVHQSMTAPSDMTVYSLVLAGRTPYRKLLSGTSTDDRLAVKRAMRDTDTEKYAALPLSALSGGQLQRVRLAMALAQETDILLLDEITTYLDIHYQLELLHLIRLLNLQKKLTVVAVLHDINLALEFCDNAVIMKDGCITASGNVSKVISEDTLNYAFDVSSRIISPCGKRYCIFEKRSKQ